MTIIIISHETFFIFMSPHYRLWTFAVSVHWSVQWKHFSEELTLRNPSVSVWVHTHPQLLQTHKFVIAKNLQSKRQLRAHTNVHTPTCTHYRPQNYNSQFSLYRKGKKKKAVDWTSKNRRQGSVLPQFATPTHTPVAIIPRFISVRQSSTGNERRSLFQRWLIGIEMLHSSRQSIKSNWSESTGWSGKSTACGPS